jgi:hypothetical protein
MAHSAIVFRLPALIVYHYSLAEPAQFHGFFSSNFLLRAAQRFLPHGPDSKPMPLDSDIKRLVQTAIEGDLAAPKVPKERTPKLKKVWKCNSASDFLYGQRSGYYAGMAEGLMLERRGRQLTEEEAEEVFQAMAPYLGRLRRYFSYYRPHKKK